MNDGNEPRLLESQDAREAIGAVSVAASMFLAILAAVFAAGWADRATHSAAASTATHPLPAGRSP